MRTVRWCFAVVLVTFIGWGSTSPAGAQSAGSDPNAADPEGQRRFPGAADQPMASKVQRWFELQTLSLLARYRYVETDTGVVTSRQLQDSLTLKGRLKADANGYYTLNFGVASGPSFTSGWNNTGVGSGDRNLTELYMKQLFVAAAPVNGLQFSFGGLAFVRGESTEITSYDNDGYLLGERVTVTHPALYLSEITFTNAYVGDVTTPNVFARYRRLGDANYRQMFVAKQVTPWLAVSADYTRLAGVGTARAAIAARTPGARIVDHLQFEEYRRGGADAAFGFGVLAEKTVWRAVARAGYADIDPGYGGLNADRFNAGRRWYVQSDLALTRDLTAWVFVAHAVHNAFAVPNATRFDIVLTYNAMGPLRRAGVFR